ncbi:unnamed protein product [Thelazia callipaeda]|uniref:PHD-type domain-containing protein n=1 Tax=Thelazia callipaeda TaxID=103827 RepID=A0A158RBZ0_THECL|nr:unnamed protein product [Thelazia callipaeda]
MEETSVINNSTVCTICLEKRSQCPLCKKQTKSLIVINKVNENFEIVVRQRTATEYEREISFQYDLGDPVQSVEDITVVYARCQVCGLSKDEHLLLLCDGIVGHNVDGTIIRCNAACHCYCLPEKLDSVPRGEWFCSFCADLKHAQKSVYNTSYVRPTHALPSNAQQLIYLAESDLSDEIIPGKEYIIRPSGMINQAVVRNGDQSYVNILDNDRSLSESRLENENNWDELDDMVLTTDSDSNYDATGKTEVIRPKKLRKKLIETIGINSEFGRQKERNKNRRNLSRFLSNRVLYPSTLSIRGENTLDIPVDEPSSVDLIAEIMLEQSKTLTSSGHQHISRGGVKIETKEGIVEKKSIDENIAFCKELISKNIKDSDEKVSMYSTRSNQIDAKEKRKRPTRWGTPTTSNINTHAIVTASIPLPVGSPETDVVVSVENIPIPSTNQNSHLSQATVPSRTSAVDTDPSTSYAMDVSASLPSLRMTNGQPQINLASFAGSNIAQQSLGFNQQSLVSLGQQAFASFNQQSVPGLNHPQLTPIAQSPIVQMQPSLLPNFFLPPLNLSAMNGFLAAGLLASNNPLGAPPITQPLAPQPSSAATAQFILNPMQQLSAASAHHLNQHLVNLTSTLQEQQSRKTPDTTQLSQDSVKQPEGVPPPPPVMKPPEPVSSNNTSLYEPLAEKIRKIIEASNVKPLCDSNIEDGFTNSTTVIEDRTNSGPYVDLKVGESGRKSASADDEEADEAVKAKKFHGNGAMFEEARQMLSSSLKKVYRLKQITKEEYKEIMKKGVAALSQRTKLDQKKVDDYAAKYVECIVHRRKKRHQI